MSHTAGLPSLDQTLDELEALEKKYDEGQRIAQTRRALDINEAIALDNRVIQAYYGDLAEKELYVIIYGTGEAPWALPVHLPPYLIDLMAATARVLLALMRKQLTAAGPDYLIRRMPEGWLTPEMAAILHRYYLTCEPDLAFDVLVHGVNSPRGTTFEAFKNAGDQLSAKILEAQSVDTYYGWLRECIRSARRTGAFEDAAFTTVTSRNRPLTDAELDRQVRATYVHGVGARPDRILFMEIDPKNQPSFQNLALLSAFLSGGGSAGKPFVLDPQDLFLRENQLFWRWQGKSGPIEKVVSRIVDSDLNKYIRKMTAEGKSEVIERLRKIYALPSLWPDLSKHLAGFYLIDKSSLTELSLLDQVTMAPKTWIITENHLKSYRRDPHLLKNLAIKPLHGMSSKGVVVTPGLAALEKLSLEETMLAQELLRATPLMPNINHELEDPDARAGICCEIRLQFHAGSPVVPESPERSRCILAISRSHYTSKDPGRKIKGDPQGRGWFSNMGAIMMVKEELGIIGKRDAGLGMSPVCWVQ